MALDLRIPIGFGFVQIFGYCKLSIEYANSILRNPAQTPTHPEMHVAAAAASKYCQPANHLTNSCPTLYQYFVLPISSVQEYLQIVSALFQLLPQCLH